jgi:hypothetical protein
MTLPIVKTAIESDEASVIDTLKLAFVADPVTWPDPQKYLSHYFSFAKAFGGKAFAYESAHYVGNYSGAALWLPSNVHPDVDLVIALLQSSGSDEAKKDVPEVLEKMSSYHKSRFWCLIVFCKLIIKQEQEEYVY